MAKKIIKATKAEQELYGPSYHRVVDTDELIMIPKIPLEYYLKNYHKQLLLPFTVYIDPKLNWFDQVMKIIESENI